VQKSANRKWHLKLQANCKSAEKRPFRRIARNDLDIDTLNRNVIGLHDGIVQSSANCKWHLKLRANCKCTEKRPLRRIARNDLDIDTFNRKVITLHSRSWGPQTASCTSNCKPTANVLKNVLFVELQAIAFILISFLGILRVVLWNRAKKRQPQVAPQTAN
jgi:hypothetical protein